MVVRSIPGWTEIGGMVLSVGVGADMDAAPLRAGVGGVGSVTAVGAKRDADLLFATPAEKLVGSGRPVNCGAGRAFGSSTFMVSAFPAVVLPPREGVTGFGVDCVFSMGTVTSLRGVTTGRPVAPARVLVGAAASTDRLKLESGFGVGAVQVGPELPALTVGGSCRPGDFCPRDSAGETWTGRAACGS
jgi:hypothetical protein